MEFQPVASSDANDDSELQQGCKNYFKRNRYSPSDVSFDSGASRRLDSPDAMYYDSEEDGALKFNKRRPSLDGQALCSSLPINCAEIRLLLLLLHPGQDDDRIYCSL